MSKKQFILGRVSENTDELQEFKSRKNADFECIDWCTVEAETLEDAKQKYEKQFEDHKKAGRISGCM